ncbi:hypothetical protein [Geobacter benzoatilyticus]|uniref:Uncharacterized protein n=1 Tax=Geobacter benzoatilyticus TaxID=2815309 RepID=A0ABX7Q1B2_9BACT|nr:hypothetical protein [Geobacter benzoatilyticus]QSV44901.1 hypothetical protein JZM60_12165 [Geobacter benzoatilyticus]
MLEQIKERIFTFGVKNRAYHVTRSEHSVGKDRGFKARYFLTRVTRPSWMVVRIRISAADKDYLAENDNAARVAMSEKLITEQLCQNCRRDKAREPPTSEHQESQNHTSNLL